MEGVASSIASVDRHIARIEYYLKRMRQNSVAHTGLVRLPSHGSALKGYHSSLRIGTTALSQPKSCVSPKKHHHTVKNIEMGLKPEFKSRTDDIKSETKWTPLCKNIEVLTQTHTKHLPKRAESAIVGKDMKQPNMGLRGKSDEYLSRQRRKQSTGFSETNVTSALFLGATTVLGDSPPLMNTTSALLHSGESSFDSLLSKASSASFSSFEYDPAGEFATRTLQWRRAAYGLLASHYEKAFGLLYMAELGEGHSSVTAADLLSVTNLDHRFPHFSTENTSGDARPSALRNDKLNSASASSTHDLIHAERSDRGGSWSHHSIFRREPQEDRSSLPNYSKHIPNKQNVGARTPPLGNRCYELLTETQHRDAVVGRTIESQEDEGVTNLLRWAGESAASATERSAYRLQEQRRYLQCQQLLNELQREECAIRDTIESQEDEGVTNLLRRVIRSNTLRSGSMLSVDVAGICASSDDKIVLDSEQRANTVLTTVLHELSTTREPLEGAGKSLIGASDRSGCDISISTTTGAEAIHYSAALEHRVTTPLRVADVADQHELPAVEATYPTAEPTKGYVWTEDQSNQVVSSYSDMVSCVEEQCYISLFKLVQREARNRWHNERAEYYARNEMRWDELNCYRSLVQWPPSPSLCFEEYAGDVAGSGGGHCEIEANNAALFKDEARATELYTDASLLCKRPHRNEPALLMVKDVTEPLEDPVPAEYQANEQNTGSLVIFDEAEHPKQHEKAVVWSINITDGRCSTPPHLRDRPWAPLLMRKSAVQGSIANDSDFTGYNVKRRKKVRSTECAGTATHGAASASGEARFVTLSRSNPCGSLQVCQKARQQGNTAAPIGYAEIYRLHLRKQRAQSLRGAQHLQPFYSKVTVSFLESAEWRYQKMYVDNYLFPSLSPMRGAPRVRKCADGVCSEVERAASIWDLAGY